VDKVLCGELACALLQPCVASEAQASQTQEAQESLLSDPNPTLTSRQRERHIQHQRNIRNIQPSRRNIRRDQHIHFPTLKVVERLEPRILVHVPMQRTDIVVGPPYSLFETLRLLFVQCKHEDTGRRGVGRRMRFEVRAQVV
jgi:hypothetical protein